MIIEVNVLKNAVDENEKEFQLKEWKQHITNDLLEIVYNDERIVTFYILDGNYHNYTPYGYIRETKNYYVKANYSNYTIIDKNTLEVEVVDDEI